MKIKAIVGDASFGNSLVFMFPMQFGFSQLKEKTKRGVSKVRG